MSDRDKGILKMKLVKSKETQMVKEAIIELLVERKPLKSAIASDNEKELAEHEQIAEALNVGFYFAKPDHSWQRGAKENLNGLVLQYFPKKIDFALITEAQIEKVTNIINNRPRKRYQYKSPNYVFATTLDNQTQFALIT